MIPRSCPSSADSLAPSAAMFLTHDPAVSPLIGRFSRSPLPWSSFRLLSLTIAPRSRRAVGRLAAPRADATKESSRFELLVINPNVVQRHGQLAHHGYHRPPSVILATGFLRLVPGTHAALLHQAQHRKIEPLPCPRAAALADPQPSLVFAAAPLRQVQTPRLAIGGRSMILSWVSHARPQDARGGHAHHLALGLKHLVLGG